MRNFTFHITGPGVDSMARASLEELDDALELTRLIVAKFKRDAASPREHFHNFVGHPVASCSCGAMLVPADWQVIPPTGDKRE